MVSQKHLDALEKVRAIKIQKQKERKTLNEQIDAQLGLKPGTTSKLERYREPEGFRPMWYQALLVSMQITGARNPGNLDLNIAMADAVLHAYKKKFPR